MSGLKVLSVASEVFPLIKTGGLADVVGALPRALAGEGVEMRTLVPGYPAVLGALEGAQEVQVFAGLFGTARLLAGKARGLNLFVLDAPYLYGRPGNPYTAPDGTDWPDNAYRFAALGKVAAEIGLGMLPAFQPGIVHMHDWQAGLSAAYMHYSGKAAPGTVMTVHNLAFQGQFPAELVMPLGLPPASFAWDGVEHYGAIGFLKAGLQLADRITTVSPAYAAEIMQPEAGMGFDGLLMARADRVSGILNGLDTAVWDPASDPFIAHTYDATSLVGRAANREALRNDFGLSQEPGVLIGVVSRLSWQKGLDLLLEVLPTLIDQGMQLALLGAGEAELEAKFQAAAEAHPGRIGVRTGYDEALAHRIQAGADVLLVPSRFEPCGLTQLAALRYGAVPVVAGVGGLSDTVIDANEMAVAANAATGVQFHPVTSDALAAALRRTAKLFRDRSAWRTMQKNGMATDVSWRRPAQRYASLYRELHASKTVAAVSGSEKAAQVAAAIPQFGTGRRASAGQAGHADAQGTGISATAPGAGTLSSEAERVVEAAIEPGKPSIPAMRGLESSDAIPLPVRAAPESGKSVAPPAEAADSAKTAAPAAETAGFEPGNDATAAPAATVAENSTGKPKNGGETATSGEKAEHLVPLPVLEVLESLDVAIALSEKAGPEGGKSVSPFAEKAAPENGKGIVPAQAKTIAENGKAAAPVAENLRSSSPEGGSANKTGSVLSLPEMAAPEAGKRAVLLLEAASAGSAKDMFSPAGTASPENEENLRPKEPMSGSAKQAAQDGEAEASAEEADYIASIGWQDT